MAGAIMTSFSAGDANATALMENANKTSIGLGSLSLTHMTDTTVPAIAAGSWIEINGAIAKFDTETAISTTDPVTSATVADGTVYIILIPSGSVVNAYFTATAPTWSDSKQGWYGLTTWANDRYITIECNKASTSYTKYTLNNHMFSAQNDSDTTATTAAVVGFTTENYDHGNVFDTSTKLFTCKAEGFYRISASVNVNDPTTYISQYTTATLHLYKNGSAYKTKYPFIQSDGNNLRSQLLATFDIIEYCTVGTIYGIYIENGTAIAGGSFNAFKLS